MNAQSSTAETTEALADRPPTRARAKKMSGKKKAVVFGALVLVVALVVTGVLLWRAADQREQARADAAATAAALDAGRKEIATMTAIDHQHTAEVLNRWLGATTGGLHQTLANSGKNLMTSVVRGKLNTSGKVVAAKVTRMNREAGTASLSADVEVTLSYQGVAASTKRDPIQADLALDGAQWKLSSMSGAGSPVR